MTDDWRGSRITPMLFDSCSTDEGFVSRNIGGISILKSRDQRIAAAGKRKPAGQSFAYCSAASQPRRRYVRLIYRIRTRQQCVDAHKETCAAIRAPHFNMASA
jgi:hypothetical protein